MKAVITESESQASVERIFDLLTLGYSALFGSASRTGHWNEARCTALAAMCLQVPIDGKSLWLRTVSQWIKGCQVKQGDGEGSWGDEVWDTAMCVLALKELEVSSKDPSIEAALAWMGALFSSNGRQNWHDEPWETSWALISILRTGREHPGIDIPAAIEWLIGLQSNSGKIISPHYTAYFLLIDKYANKVRLNDDIRTLMSKTIAGCKDYLLSELETSDPDALWTGEAWSNGQILWILCTVGAFPVRDERAVEKTIAWFEGKQSVSGNWSDVEDTASAILGLYALLRNLVITADADRSEKVILDRLERRLRKAVTIPKLATKRNLFQYDEESDYVSMNIKGVMLRRVLTVTAFIFVGVVSWLANVMALLEGAWKYLRNE